MSVAHLASFVQSANVAPFIAAITASRCSANGSVEAGFALLTQTRAALFNAAWRAAGYALSTQPQMADEAVDQWRKPYERTGDTKAAMNEYLAWEIDLLPRVTRDGSSGFV